MLKTFIDTLCALAKDDNRIFLLTADVGYSVLDEFRKEFPDRYFNIGVAEANTINVASGLALSDKIVYVYSMAHFITTRCYEQIRLNLCYQNTNVKIVGVGGGLTYGSAGATHHAIEDISIMRSLPNMCVLCPGDKSEIKHAIEASLRHMGPVYIRVSKESPQIHKNNIDFKIGKGIILKKGRDLNILTTGNMLEISKSVSDKLGEVDIDAGVISIHTVKPLDVDLVTELAYGGSPIFTVEEHSIIGGLGSAVSELLAELDCNVLFRRIGLPDKFSHIVGDQKYQRMKFGIDDECIYQKILIMYLMAKSRTGRPMILDSR